jgi:transcriptional regulator with XRE-family HTH domain
MDTVEQYSFGAMVGAWFRCLRNYNKATLDRVSEVSGINRTRLHRLERDGTSMTVIEMLALAKTYEISPWTMTAIFNSMERAVKEHTSEALVELFEDGDPKEVKKNLLRVD